MLRPAITNTNPGEDRSSSSPPQSESVYPQASFGLIGDAIIDSVVEVLEEMFESNEVSTSRVVSVSAPGQRWDM